VKERWKGWSVSKRRIKRNVTVPMNPVIRRGSVVSALPITGGIGNFLLVSSLMMWRRPTIAL